MSQPAIRVEGLGKRYRIGARQQGSQTFREALTDLALAPVRRLRRTAGNGFDPDTVWALKDVSFDVQPGEVVGIIGRNGAGKSTLLKILSRITEPTSGRIEVRGRVASLLEVGTGFHSELSGRENIYLNGAILGMTRREIDRKFDEIVAFAEVERFIDTPVKRYSSGMYLRLAFAVAAHLEPEILLVDEVLAVGDAGFQKKCLGKMGEAARQGRTVLFVSHNMAAVQQLCTRAVLILAGRVEHQGDPGDVIRRYTTDALQATDGHFDLRSHPARSACHRPIIRNLILRAADESSTSYLMPYQPLSIDLHLRTAAPIRAPRVAVSVEDATGRRLFTVASHFAGTDLVGFEHDSYVRCTIPTLPLATGRYLMSVSIATPEDGLLDSLDRVAWFEVGWANSHGNGEPHLPAHGPVLCRSVWEQRNNTESHAPTSPAVTAQYS